MAKRHNATDLNSTSAVAVEGTQYPGWIIYNVSDVTIYLGDSDVTAATGFPVEANSVFSPSEISHRQLNGYAAARLWGIAASGTGKSVRVLVPGRV